jgi:hypothetical protein
MDDMDGKVVGVVVVGAAVVASIAVPAVASSYEVRQIVCIRRTLCSKLRHWFAISVRQRSVMLSPTDLSNSARTSRGADRGFVLSTPGICVVQ